MLPRLWPVACRPAGAPPGFGHKIYQGEDPRLAPLLEAVAGAARTRPAGATSSTTCSPRPAPWIMRWAERRDLGVGALSYVGELPADVPSLAVARLAGFRRLPTSTRSSSTCRVVASLARRARSLSGRVVTIGFRARSSTPCVGDPCPVSVRLRVHFRFGFCRCFPMAVEEDPLFRRAPRTWRRVVAPHPRRDDHLAAIARPSVAAAGDVCRVADNDLEGGADAAARPHSATPRSIETHRSSRRAFVPRNVSSSRDSFTSLRPAAALVAITRLIPTTNSTPCPPSCARWMISAASGTGRTTIVLSTRGRPCASRIDLCLWLIQRLKSGKRGPMVLAREVHPQPPSA